MPEEDRRERQVVKDALDLARELTPVADVDPEEPDPLDEIFAGDNRRTTFETFPATLSVARRRGLPISSDDRFVRLTANRDGIETFGSTALLAALEERKDVPDDAVAMFRHDLLRHGAVGLRPTGGEIAALAEEHDDQPVGYWVASLLDPAGWRNDADEQLRQCVVFLRHAWHRRPELLSDWTARVLNCAARALPQYPPEFFARVALVYLWFVLEHDDDHETHRAFVSALLDAFDEAPAKLAIPIFANLLGEAIGIAYSAAPQKNSDMRRWMLIGIARQLRFPIDAKMLLAFWNSV